MNPGTSFTITEKEEGPDRICLQVTGDLDVRTSPQLKRAMNTCFAHGVEQIHVMLDGVPRMDSSGIATLVEGLRWSRLPGHRFMLSGLNEAVRDLFVLSKLEGEFELLADGVRR